MLKSTVSIGKGYRISGGFKVAGKVPKSWRVQLCNMADSTATLRGRKNSRKFGGLVGISAATYFSNDTVRPKVPQNASQ